MKIYWMAVWSVFVVSQIHAHGDKEHVLDTSKEGMKAIAHALGVKCVHCHPSEKENGKRDYKAPSKMKETALYMKNNYVDGVVTREGERVDCTYCHQNEARFIVRDTTLAKPSRLAGKPRSEIVAIMKEMQNALGVKACDYCHVRGRDGRLDPKVPTVNKVIARSMMEHFTDRLLDIKTGKPVTCKTCHDGKTTFLPKSEE